MGKKKQDIQTQADFAFPSAWTLFGPVGKDDAEPDFVGMNAVPKDIGHPKLFSRRRGEPNSSPQPTVNNFVGSCRFRW